MFEHKEYVVTSVEVVKRDEKTEDYQCELTGWFGHKISFSLRTKGCVGEQSFTRQKAAVEPLMRKGEMVYCNFVYQKHMGEFGLALYYVQPIEPHSSSDGRIISSEQYYNPNRGFWVHTRPKSEGVYIPDGFISLHGEVYLPILDGWYTQVSHLSWEDAHKGDRDIGFVWKSGPSLFKRAWKRCKSLFGKGALEPSPNL